MSQNWKSTTQETFTVFVTKKQWFWSHNRFIRRKNRDSTKEVLFIIVSDRHQRHFEVVYIADNVIQFSFITRWDEINDSTSKSQQSVRRIRNFKWSASSEFNRTDFDINQFVQRMCNSQILLKAVQKSSDNSTMQIKEEQLHWFKNVLTHCSARHHE